MPWKLIRSSIQRLYLREDVEKATDSIKAERQFRAAIAVVSASESEARHTWVSRVSRHIYIPRQNMRLSSVRFSFLFWGIPSTSP